MTIHPQPTPFPPYFHLITGPEILLAHCFLEKRQNAAKVNDALTSLEHLYRLLKMGAITQEGFDVMKEKLKEPVCVDKLI